MNPYILLIKIASLLATEEQKANIARLLAVPEGMSMSPDLEIYVKTLYLRPQLRILTSIYHIILFMIGYFVYFYFTNNV